MKKGPKQVVRAPERGKKGSKPKQILEEVNDPDEIIDLSKKDDPQLSGKKKARNANLHKNKEKTDKKRGRKKKLETNQSREMCFESAKDPFEDNFPQEGPQLSQDKGNLDQEKNENFSMSQKDFQEEDSAESVETQLAKTLHAFKQQLEIMGYDEPPPKSTVSDRFPQLKSIIDDDLTPTYQQIASIMQEFKEKFSQDNILKIIFQLYVSLIKKEADGQNSNWLQNQKITEQKIELGNQNTNFENNMMALSNSFHKKSILKRFIRNPEIGKSFANPQERIKYLERNIISRSFCNRGYGMQGINDEIQQSGSSIMIDRGRYKNLVSTIVIEAYRKLENFLIDECHREIKPLNRDELRTIQTILLNCRKNFQTEEYSTFLKFMKIAFSLASVTITEEAAIKLYIVVQKALRTRIGEMQLDRMADTMRCNKEFKAKRSFQSQRFQLHRIWTDELESELLDQYKRNPQLQKIRDFFKRKYSDNQHFFTIESLRSRFNKILRVALRKTHCFCQKFGQQRIPSLIKLNDLRVKNMLRSPEALNARLLLVEMYLHDECDIKRLYQTVSAVNQFIIMKDNQRMNQIIEAEPLINSATQKINHNVSITKSRRGSEIGSKSVVVMKGREEDFDHIVQTDNGQSLHYYRKVDTTSKQGKDPEIKDEEEEPFKYSTSFEAHESEHRSSQDDPFQLLQQNTQKQASKFKVPFPKNNLLQSIIKEEMQRYLSENTYENLSSMSKE